MESISQDKSRFCSDAKSSEQPEISIYHTKLHSVALGRNATLLGPPSWIPFFIYSTVLSFVRLPLAPPPKM